MNKTRSDLKMKRIYAHTVEPVHHFYREQFSVASKTFEYFSNVNFDLHREKEQLVPTDPVTHLRRRVMKHVDPFQLLKIPLVKPLQVPNADVIHSGNVLLSTKNDYWVDFEEFGAFANYDSRTFGYAHFKHLLQKRLEKKELKYILPWTNAAKKGVETVFGHDEKIMKKVKVVYPCIHAHPLKKKKHAKVRLLFIGKQFYEKGGLETIMAFLLLDPFKYQLTMISKFPAEIRARYGKVEGLELLESGKNLSDEKIKEIYSMADVFVFPSHMDTLGWVLFEAKAHGLPIVATKQYAIPEVVGKGGVLVENHVSDHGVNGLRLPLDVKRLDDYQRRLRNPPMDAVVELVKAIEGMGKSKRTKMGEANRLDVTTGKFSVKQRVKAIESLLD